MYICNYIYTSISQVGWLSYTRTLPHTQPHIATSRVQRNNGKFWNIQSSWIVQYFPVLHSKILNYPRFCWHVHATLNMFTILSRYSHDTLTILSRYSHDTPEVHDTLTILSRYSHDTLTILCQHCPHKTQSICFPAHHHGPTSTHLDTHLYMCGVSILASVWCAWLHGLWSNSLSAKSRNRDVECFIVIMLKQAGIRGWSDPGMFHYSILFRRWAILLPVHSKESLPNSMYLPVGGWEGLDWWQGLKGFRPLEFPISDCHCHRS